MDLRAKNAFKTHVVKISFEVKSVCVTEMK